MNNDTTSQNAKRRRASRALQMLWPEGCRVLTALTAALLVSGCWSSDPEPEPEQEAHELKPKEEVTTDASQDELVKASKRLFEARMFSVAKQSFQSLRDNFPGGPYALFSELKIADCLYFNREYVEAGAAYQEYFKNNPGTPDVAYAKLQAARSLIHSNRGVGRDKGPLEKALTILDGMLKSEQNSPLLPEARSERAIVVDRLAKQEQLIADFYNNQDKPEAAKARQVAFNERWAPLLMENRAEQTGDRPMTPLKAASRTSITLPVPALARVDRSTPMARGIGNRGLERPALVPNSPGVVLQKVQCKQSGHPFVSLEVSRVPADGIDQSFSPTEGKIVFRLKGLVTDGLTMNCFGENDLTIGQDGIVTLQVNQTMRLTSLALPPRLLLTFEK